jgi:hypothetical protein
MFRILLQTEEQDILDSIREGLYPNPIGLLSDPVLLKLIAFRMVKCDQYGNPKLTDLAEAALARIKGKIH